MNIFKKELWTFSFIGIFLMSSCNLFFKKEPQNNTIDYKFYPNKLTILVDNYTKNYPYNYIEQNNNNIQLEFNIQDSILFTGAQNIGIWLSNPEKKKINSIGIKIYFAKDNQWKRSNLSRCFYTNFDDGTELYRWPVSDGNTKSFGIYPSKIKITINGESTKNIKILYIFAETQPKAKLLLVEDGGYSKGWIKTNMVQGQEFCGSISCSMRNIPITWALNPKKIDDRDPKSIPLEYLKKMQNNSNNHWSFHSYNRQVLANATVDELKEDVLNSINWLKKNGFGEIHFRAAYTQNNAPNAVYLKNFLKDNGIYATGTYTQATGGFETFPFTQRWNLDRYDIHGATKNDIDRIFKILKERHCLIIPYTHKIIPDTALSSVDIKLSMWNYFLKKIDEGVSDGWLEAISYEDLENTLKQYKINDNDNDIAIAILKQLIFQSTVEHSNK